MNRKDPLFRDLNGTIQVRFRALREEGVGAQVSHASVILLEEEDMVWASKVIGNHSPLALQRSIMLERHFALEGVKSRGN